MKKLTGFFLLCGIIILSAGELRAFAGNHSSCTTQHNIDKITHTGFNFIASQTSIASVSALADEPINIGSALLETTEDETNSHEKHLKTSHFFMLVLCALAFKGIFDYISQSLGYNKSFSHSTSYSRFISLRVIRL